MDLLVHDFLRNVYELKHYSCLALLDIFLLLDLYEILDALPLESLKIPFVVGCSALCRVNNFESNFL